MAMMTKTEQTEKHIRGELLKGRWEPGERLPSEEELLTELGISRTTLRSAMHVLMVDGLVVRKNGSGTYAAHSTKRGLVGILAKAMQLTSQQGFWYRSLMEEAQERIAAADYRPILCVGNGRTPEEFIPSINLLDKPILKDTLGVLRLTKVGALEARLSSAGVDYVAIESLIPMSRYSVVLDTAAVVDLAIQSFSSHGYEDFSLMYREPYEDTLTDHEGQQDELNDMKKCLYRAAVNYREDRLVTVKWSLDYQHAYAAFKEWWSRSDRPKAMFFTDDALFDVASRAIMELGIKVPEQLAVVTLANVGREFLFPVEVERIGFDAAEVISIAWEMLRKLITGEPVDDPTVYVQPHMWNGQSL